MKKLLSYLIPFRLKNYSSQFSGPLEINLADGKKVLDTRHSNYSYGSLQRILHKGLLKINFNESTKTVLVLGLGAGSIVETIRNDFHSNAFIELVDIDAEIIQIAINEFNIHQFPNINIVNADAMHYINSTITTFDLIIVDIFIINKIPVKFTETPFIRSLANHLTPKGKILYNTFRQTMSGDAFNQLKSRLEEEHLHVTVMNKVDWTNDLLIAEK